MMEPMPNRTSRLPFTSTDKACLHSRYAAARAERRHIYDIEVTTDCRESAKGDPLRDGIVTLSSRNLGYDFALVHVGAGKGMLRVRKSVVEIYARKQGSERYAFLKAVANLQRALALIDRIYEEAAARHLP